MYKFALIIGFYSYSIFFLGILGLIKPPYLLVDTLLLILFIYFSFKDRTGVDSIDIGFIRKLGNAEKGILSLIVVQVVVNFVGALGPELAFDSLWYHLTLPKLFLAHGSVFHVPGSLLYYSDMPKLIEMLYIPALALGSEIIAKIIHFSFGLLCLAALYSLSRKFLSQKLSLLVCLIFYSNLVIGWLSTTAYIDLGRTFFVILSLDQLVQYIQKNELKALFLSGLMLGLAITSKVYSALDIAAFVFLILFFKRSIKDSVVFVTIAFLVPLPWFIFSYLNTGNPIYPIFTNLYTPTTSLTFSNLLNFIHSSDPISPIYIICLPLIFISYTKFKMSEKIIAVYSLLSFVVWFLAPQSGGGRFIAAYLPSFSLLIGITLDYMNKASYKKYIYVSAFLLASISILYRFGANLKYAPVVLGLQSKDQFLSKNLNFSFGDFYDTDGYLKREIKNGDKVLVRGIHNLYYVDFPFVDDSWRTKDDKYNYIATREDVLPTEFADFKKVYENDTTGIRLYKRE